MENYGWMPITHFELSDYVHFLRYDGGSHLAEMHTFSHSYKGQHYFDKEGHILDFFFKFDTDGLKEDNWET
jgi:hypothetical protein